MATARLTLTSSRSGGSLTTAGRLTLSPNTNPHKLAQDLVSFWHGHTYTCFSWCLHTLAHSQSLSLAAQLQDGDEEFRGVGGADEDDQGRTRRRNRVDAHDHGDRDRRREGSAGAWACLVIALPLPLVRRWFNVLSPLHLTSPTCNHRIDVQGC